MDHDIKCIRRKFNRAAHGYALNDHVQKQMGYRLLHLILQQTITADTILDLGSGPGYFSQLLQAHYPGAKVIAYDIAENMLGQVSAPILPVCGDMHQLPFSKSLFKLIFSNMVFHWTVDIEQLFSACQSALQEEGVLAFTFSGDDTYHELGIEKGDGGMMGVECMCRALKELGFVIDVFFEDKLPVTYKDVSYFINEIKSLGVTHISRRRLMQSVGKLSINEIEERIKAHQSGVGWLKLTFHTIYIVARKLS